MKRIAIDPTSAQNREAFWFEKAKKFGFELRCKIVKPEIFNEKRFGFLHYQLPFFLSSAGGHNAEPLVTTICILRENSNIQP